MSRDKLLAEACELEPTRFRRAVDPEGDQDTQVLVGSEWLNLNWMFLPMAGAVVQAAVQEAIEAHGWAWRSSGLPNLGLYEGRVFAGDEKFDADSESSAGEAILSAYVQALRAAKETA